MATRSDDQNDDENGLQSSNGHGDAGPSTSSYRLRSSSSSTSSLSSIFESSLTLLGSLPVATGSSSSSSNNANSSNQPHVYHTSKTFGKMKLHLADVSKFEEVRLQSHYLWPAGVRLAEMIEEGEIPVMGDSVLELGAGAALPSLVAARVGAKSVVITDYPARSVLQAIRDNVAANLSSPQSAGSVRTVGLDWANPGTVLDDLKGESGSGFSRILAADTLWISSLHEAQISCIISLLARTLQARVYIMAGLHSGRACVRQFLRIAVSNGLAILSNGGRGREWDRLEQRWLNDTEGASIWSCAHILEEEGGRQEEAQEEGTEESRRRYILYFELGWADLQPMKSQVG